MIEIKGLEVFYKSEDDYPVMIGRIIKGDKQYWFQANYLFASYDLTAKDFFAIGNKLDQLNGAEKPAMSDREFKYACLKLSDGSASENHQARLMASAYIYADNDAKIDCSNMMREDLNQLNGGGE